LASNVIDLMNKYGLDYPWIFLYILNFYFLCTQGGNSTHGRGACMAVIYTYKYVRLENFNAMMTSGELLLLSQLL
jgi:hypothetical protein